MYLENPQLLYILLQFHHRNQQPKCVSAESAATHPIRKEEGVRERERETERLRITFIIGKKIEPKVTFMQM